MARDTIDYLNATVDGYGVEGLVSWSNRVTDYLMAPLFLIILYGLAIYVASKSEWKLGASVSYISLFFFISSWILQSFLKLNQLVIFIFFLGILTGFIISYVEEARQ